VKHSLDVGSVYVNRKASQVVVVTAMYDTGAVLWLTHHRGWPRSREKVSSSWSLLSMLMDDEFEYAGDIYQGSSLRGLSNAKDLKDYKNVGRHDWEVRRRLIAEAWNLGRDDSATRCGTLKMDVFLKPMKVAEILVVDFVVSG